MLHVLLRVLLGVLGVLGVQGVLGVLLAMVLGVLVAHTHSLSLSLTHSFSFLCFALPTRPRAGILGIPRGCDTATHLSPLGYPLLLHAADAGH